MKLLIADASSIISFSRAKKLDLLKKVVKKIIIPEEVYKEIVVKGRGKPGAKEVASAEWIEVRKVRNKMRIAALPAKLGHGEREAIVLCEELEGTLLIDDLEGKEEAMKLKIKYLTTPNILQLAKEQGLIPNVRESFDELIRAGFRISDKTYQNVLLESGEI